MIEAEAISKAHEVAQGNGWPWETPIVATRRRRGIFSRKMYWEVRSNASRRGRNAVVVIDDETGRVESSHFAPR
jgi:hypothetical protein